MEQQDIDAFANALQLSIQSRIQSVEKMAGVDAGIFRHFIGIYVDPVQTDQGWKYFNQLVSGSWDKKHEAYCIPELQITTSLISFLLLTRLQPEQMHKLAELDPQYAPLIAPLQLKFPTKAAVIATVQESARVIFQRIEQQRLTLREVAERSGLTQVSISKFKAGNDVKFSNLLKIAQVAGFTVRLVSDK